MAAGFTFNGIHSSVHGIGIKVKRPLIPSVADNYIDLPGRAGSFLYPGKPLDRYISVECGIQPASRALFRSKLWEIAAWLYTQDRVALVFDDEPGKTYRAKIEGAVDLEQVGTIGKFTLTFRCDPFAYGAEVTETFTADALTLTNSGTYEAYPRFSVSFTGSDSELKITSGTNYIRVVDSFVYGDVLSIDCATGAILKNGVRTMNKLDWQYSKLFALAVGSNTLTITPTGKCSAQVKYDPTYL